MRSASTNRQRSASFRRRRRATRTPRRSSRRLEEAGGAAMSRKRNPKESHSMTKRMLIMLGTVGLFFGGILVFQLLVKPAMMRKFIPIGVIPPQTVSTTKAEFSEWRGEFLAGGTLRAGRAADVAPEGP